MIFAFNAITGKFDLVNEAGVIPLGTSFPASPTAGLLFYKTDAAALYIWTGTAWIAIGSGTPETFNLLTEAGDTLTAENGDHVALE